MSIYKKIFASSILKYAIFVFLLTFIVFLLSFKNHSIENSHENLKSKFGDRVEYLSDYIESKKNTVNLIANSQVLKNFAQQRTVENEKNLKTLIFENHKADNTINQIRIRDKNDEIIFDLHNNHQFTHNDSHDVKLGTLDAQNSLSSFYFTTDDFSGTKFLALEIASNAFGTSNQKIGRCDIEFDMTKMFKIFSRTTLYDVYLIDANGNIIVHSEDENLGQNIKTIKDIFPSDVVDGILKSDYFFDDAIIAQKLTFLPEEHNIKMILSNKDELAKDNLKNNIIITFAVIVLVLFILSYFKILPKFIFGDSLIDNEIDRLTNLPNRSKLISDFSQSMNMAIAIINIDNFKEINNVYGFKNGDELLKLFAQRIEALIELFEKNEKISKDQLSLYKMSGDEFAVVISDANLLVRDNLNKFCQYLHSGIEDVKYKSNDFSIDLKVTLGISNPLDIQPASDALLQADLAHKIAKNIGNDWVIYEPDLSIVHQYKKNLHWIGEIKRAIERDDVIPYFQPIYNIKTKKIDKYEALIRIVDSNGNIASPADFLELSKKVKLYHKISAIHAKKVIEKILETQCDISINLNVDDFSDAEYLFDLMQLVKYRNIGHRITFEIVESEQARDKEGLAKFVELVHLFGVQVAIDDFGSGYSNFAHFINAKVDYLKIDGSLIQNILTDENSQRTVKAIVGLAKMLNIKVVAEYVSNKEIFDHLSNGYDLDYLQGFYIGKPSADFLSDV